jgi:hypothetical protein
MFADPWSELTQPEAARRYRTTLRRIIRRLRGELNREVRRAERLIQRGGDISNVLEAAGAISPLGCFIVAVRAGQEELAGRFAVAAAAQHRACPLCRQASLGMLAADLYPVEAKMVVEEVKPDLKPRVEKVLLSLN